MEKSVGHKNIGKSGTFAARDFKARVTETNMRQTTIFHQENIDTLTSKIEPVAEFPTYQTIYALIPVEKEHYRQCFVLTEDLFQCVESCNYQIINSLIQTHLHIQPKLYRYALATVFHHYHYKLSCGLPNYSLIPLGAINSKPTIWINPAQISAIKEGALATCIHLRNGFQIRCELTRKSIHNSMQLGFICQGIVRREWSYDLLHEYLPLQEYLQILGTNEINHVIRSLTIADIPGKRGDMMKNYHIENELEIIRKINDREERLGKPKAIVC